MCILQNQVCLFHRTICKKDISHAIKPTKISIVPFPNNKTLVEIWSKQHLKILRYEHLG